MKPYRPYLALVSIGAPQLPSSSRPVMPHPSNSNFRSAAAPERVDEHSLSLRTASDSSARSEPMSDAAILKLNNLFGLSPETPMPTRLIYLGSNIRRSAFMSSENDIGARSIGEFCRWAGIGRSLAYKEISAGRLKTKKVGRRTLITTDAASAWLNELPDTPCATDTLR